MPEIAEAVGPAEGAATRTGRAAWIDVLEILLSNLLRIAAVVVVATLFVRHDIAQSAVNSVVELLSKHDISIKYGDLIIQSSHQTNQASIKIEAASQELAQAENSNDVNYLREAISSALTKLTSAETSVNAAGSTLSTVGNQIILQREQDALQQSGSSISPQDSGILDAPFLVIAGGDRDLPAASDELKRYSSFDPILFARVGWYRTALPAQSLAQASQIVSAISANRPDAYVVRTASWCPTAKSETATTATGATFQVFTCDD